MTLSQLMLVTLTCLFLGVSLLVLTLYVWPAIGLRWLIRISSGRWLLGLMGLPGLRALFADRLLGLWLWDLDRRRIILVGDGLGRLGFAQNKVEVSADAVLPLLHPGDQRQLKYGLQHFLRGASGFSLECRLAPSLEADARTRIFGVGLQRDNSGRLQLALGAIEHTSGGNVNVTATAAANEQLQQRLDQQEQQLHTSELARQNLVARLRQVLDTVPVSICWKDLQGNYLGCNAQFARAAGLTSPDAIVGKTDRDFGWSGQQAEIRLEDEKVIASGQPLLDLDQELLLPGQKLRRMRCCHVPLRDVNGDCIGVLKTYQNVTPGYLLAQASDREQRLLQDVLDSTDAMISLVDRNFRFVRINRLLETVVGIERGSFLGKQVTEVFPGKLGERATEIVDHIIRTHQPVKEPYVLRDPLGKIRHFYAYNNPLFDDQGNVDKIITVSMEITQLRQAQVALEAAREKAEAATQVKSQFLANMSHEIRTPMNAIIGLSQLALSSELNPKTEDYLQKIHYSAENLLGIVNDILDFSKIEAGKLSLNSQPFDLLQMIENMGSIMSLKANRKRLTFQQKVEPNTPRYINGDVLRLHQVLTNLIGNAVKFTRDGYIRLTVRMSVDMGERQILRFTVEDTGVGVSDQQIGQLFQAFEQADAGVAREYGGTGLGLAISRRLVEMMGGEIRVKSTVGKGSEFEFTINVGKADDKATELQLKRTGQQPVNLNGARILLVEDNEINQQVALEMLAPLNVQVDTAQNGAEALAMVAVTRYALVLMDIQMPVMDGYSATQQLRAQYSLDELPIVGLTANVLEPDRKRMLAVGMNDHVAKPINRQALEQSLIHWLQGNAQVQQLNAMANKPEVASDSVRAGSGRNGDTDGRAIDVLQALARVRGSEDRLFSLLDSFFAQYANVPDQFEQLLGAKQWSRLAGQAHAVKGVAGNLSVTRVYQLSGLLQRQAENADAACADTIFRMRAAMSEAAAEFEHLKMRGSDG